jgi:hypothetical protein
MAVSKTALSDAATAAESAMNALLAAKAAPSTLTLEAALALSTDARTALDTLTQAHQDFQNDCVTQGGTNLT